MEGEVLPVSSSSSLSAAEGTQKEISAKKDISLPQNQQEWRSAEELRTEDVTPVGDRLLSTEEQLNLITESMTVTSNDQEKLLLLNKNTELRRVNKELMKLNEEWDQVYRSAVMGLQHRLEALEQENSAVKELNSRLLVKVEHKQSAKEFYEQTLMQELKKNQEMQAYVRLLESMMYLPDKDCTPVKQGSSSAEKDGPLLCPTTAPPGGISKPPIHALGCSPSSSSSSAYPSRDAERRGKSQSGCPQMIVPGDRQREMGALKEQLEALRCQTQIYEAEYETEHNDHKQTLQENRRLKKKREEMRQQVTLLQEQLKVYEDDFRRERSDKQMLQRLLLKKKSPGSEPVLIHRCNNEQQPQHGERRIENREKRKQHHPSCHKHADTG